MHMASGFLK